MTSTADEVLIPASAVRRRLGDISDTTLSNRVKRGLLPEPLRINGRLYWPKSAIDAVIAGRWSASPAAA